MTKKRLKSYTFRNTIFSLALLTSFPTIAGDKAGDNCESNGQVMAEIRACIMEENSKSVDDAYQKVLKKITLHNPKAAELFKQSQRSWSKFANDTCRFQAVFNPKNMIPEDASTNCWIDFSQARIRILKSWENQIERGN